MLTDCQTFYIKQSILSKFQSYITHAWKSYDLYLINMASLPSGTIGSYLSPTYPFT